jgi:hypothetical protein
LIHVKRARSVASLQDRRQNLQPVLTNCIGGGVLGQIGSIVGTIFGTNVPRGKLSTGQIIARDVTRSVTNKVVGGVAADLGKSMGGSIGRAIVRGTLGGLLRR